MNNNLFELITGSDEFVSICDNGFWEYDRFGFGMCEGKCYYVKLEGDQDEENCAELKEGLSVEGILQEGVEKGLLERDMSGVYYFDMEYDDQLWDWLESLQK